MVRSIEYRHSNVTAFPATGGAAPEPHVVRAREEYPDRARWGLLSPGDRSSQVWVGDVEVRAQVRDTSNGTVCKNGTLTVYNEFLVTVEVYASMLVRGPTG